MLAILPLVAGCPTEVPYQTEPAADEAPAFDAEEPGSEESGSETASDEGPNPQTTEEPNTAAAPSNDRYATPPGGAPARMPWETEEPADETPPEAEQLFAGAKPVPKPAPEAEAEGASGPSGEGFGDFLGDAYAGMLDEEPAEEESSTEPEPEPSTVAAAAPANQLGSRYETSEPLFEPPTESTPLFEPAPAPKPSPEPKEPTTVEPSNSDLLDELWGDSSETDEPEPTPAPDEEPEAEQPNAPEPQLPFDQDEPLLPPEPEPEPAAEPSIFDEEPEPESDELPLEPAERYEAPIDPTPSEPKIDTPPPRDPPMASSAIDPLPAVPVLPFNTRHLAWLLGAKYGLAELADLDGATADEVAEWSREVERLAEELRINTPASARSVDDPAERVSRMMRSAARVGEALASAHGVDHAALLEISLKTNALLVVAEKRPDLAGPVARAVRDAADRALLPRFLWDQSVRVLESNPTPAEAHDAVTRLHERVESFLR